MQQGGVFFCHSQAYSLAVLLMMLSGCMGGDPHVPAPVEIHTPRSFNTQPTWERHQSVRAPDDRNNPSRVPQEQQQPSSRMAVKSLPPPPLTAAAHPQDPPLSTLSRSEFLSANRERMPTPSVDAEEPKMLPAFTANSPVEPSIEPLAPLSEEIPFSQKNGIASQDLKFLWPVLGTVVAPFGPTVDGLHNDGINIKVRKGTPIRSAAAGTVVFASENVKGFGQLILIKHAKGWTSAYAHMQKAIVKKDDQVKQAQIIAYSGDSGAVQFPQLHFELRKDVKAVNPLTYLVPQ